MVHVHVYSKESGHNKYTQQGPTLCKGRVGFKGYHLHESDEPNGQNLLAYNFETLKLCVHETC